MSGLVSSGKPELSRSRTLLGCPSREDPRPIPASLVWRAARAAQIECDCSVLNMGFQLFGRFASTTSRIASLDRREATRVPIKPIEHPSNRKLFKCNELGNNCPV